VNETRDERPTPLEYAPRREARGFRVWFSRFLARLSKPMPLGMYYLITFVLSIIALILVLIFRAIVSMFAS
jgi:hypothetical protein